MGASVCLTAGGVAVISVRIAYDNLVDDMTTRCATALLATLRAMWDMPKAGAQ